MPSKTKPLSSAIWIKMIFSCIQSSMVPQFALSRIRQDSLYQLYLLMKQPLLRCVIVHVGKTKSLPKFTGSMLIKSLKHHLLVCSLPQVVLSFAASVTFCSLRNSSLVSRWSFVSVRNPSPIILVRDTYVERAIMMKWMILSSACREQKAYSQL